MIRSSVILYLTLNANRRISWCKFYTKNIKFCFFHFNKLTNDKSYDINLANWTTSTMVKASISSRRMFNKRNSIDNGGCLKTFSREREKICLKWNKIQHFDYEAIKSLTPSQNAWTISSVWGDKCCTAAAAARRTFKKHRQSHEKTSSKRKWKYIQVF